MRLVSVDKESLCASVALCVCMHIEEIWNQKKRMRSVYNTRIQMELIECLEHRIKMLTTIMTNNIMKYRVNKYVVYAYGCLFSLGFHIAALNRKRFALYLMNMNLEFNKEVY